MSFGGNPSPELFNLMQNHEISGKALDLGCGDGRNSLYLSRFGLEVTAVDNSPVAIVKLGRKISENNLEGKIIPVCEDVNNFQFRENYYDLVVAITLFDHLERENAYSLFERTVHSLRNGGYILVKVHTTNDPGHTDRNNSASELSAMIKHYFDPDELRHLIGAHLDIIDYAEIECEDTTHGKPHSHAFALALAKKASNKEGSEVNHE